MDIADDKAVVESRERVRAALHAIGLGPSRRLDLERCRRPPGGNCRQWSRPGHHLPKGLRGGEAAWAGEDVDILAPQTIIQILNHVKGTQILSRPKPGIAEDQVSLSDLKDIKGQEAAKRALEVAAAGGHHLLRL